MVYAHPVLIIHFHPAAFFFPLVFWSRSSSVNSIHIHRRCPPTPPERGVKRPFPLRFVQQKADASLTPPSLAPSPPHHLPFLDSPLSFSLAAPLLAAPSFEPPFSCAEGVVLVFVRICHSYITRCPRLPHRQQPIGGDNVRFDGAVQREEGGVFPGSGWRLSHPGPVSYSFTVAPWRR